MEPLNVLVESWRREGRDVPWVDPDLGGIHSRILFLLESPGPASSTGHGSGFISPDNGDQSAARFWRLSRDARLNPRDVVIGGFAERWWLRYLRRPESLVLPLVCAPNPSASAASGADDGCFGSETEG